MKRSLACLALLFAGVAAADQFQILSQETARAAMGRLQPGILIRHYCAPCGDTTWREEAVATTQLRNAGNGFEVTVNGDAIDLAYVYFFTGGEWRNMAMNIGEEPVEVPETLAEVSSGVPVLTNALFQGTLQDDLHLFMTLSIGDGVMTGSYYYAHVGDPIDLKGTIAPDGAFEIVESVEGNQTGSFTGTFADSALSGSWQAAGKDTELPFAAKLIAKTVTEKSTGNIAGIKVSTQLAYPMFLDAGHPAAYALTRHVTATIQQDRADFLVDAVAGNTSDYAAEFGAPIWEYSSEVSDFRSVFLSDSMLSAAYITYWYTGGAHGGYGQVPVNVVVSGEDVRELTLSDFIKGNAGIARTSELVIADLKKQEASSVVSGGIKSFSAEELGNFTVTAKGIRFYFGPYAVASYAEGAFEVFVPWSELGGHADNSLLE